jgi:hypothetical protein
VVTSRKFNATLQEIETHWTILDLFEAHCILDAYDAAEADAAARGETA